MKESVDSSLLPQLAVAEARYPAVLRALMAYAGHVDAHGGGTVDEYRALQHRLEALVGKDLGTYNLWEWWEEEGAEALAFRIALPDPPRRDRAGRPSS